MRKIFLLVFLMLLFFAPPAVAFSGKVGTFFFHWYRCPDDSVSDLANPGNNACDVSNLKIKNIAPGMKKDDPYPEGGFYHWDNLNWYKRQFTDMTFAGIDYVIPLTYYRQSSTWPIHIANDAVIMSQAVTELNLPLKFGFFWASFNQCYAGPNDSNAHMCDLSLGADRLSLYRDYIKPYYQNLPRNLWATYPEGSGRPIIFTIYLEGTNLSSATTLLSEMKSYFLRDFGVDPWLIMETSWWGVGGINTDALNTLADGKYDWGNTTQAIGNYKVTLVGPGVDMRNTPWGGPSAIYIDRRNGDFFREELAKAPTDASLLMISSWNELFENTGIGRAINYKKTNGENLSQEYYMDILRNYLGLNSRSRMKNSTLEFLSVSSTVYAGTTFEVKVKATNTGLVYWSEKDNYRLGTVANDMTWGSARFMLEGNEVVFPNSSKIFTFDLKAPETAGVQKLSLKMVQENVEWFGDEASTDINIEVASAPTPSLVLKYLGRGWNFVGSRSTGVNLGQCRGSARSSGRWVLGNVYYKCFSNVSL